MTMTPAKVLLTDEPGNLDAETRDEIVTRLAQLWKDLGPIIAMVTHESTRPPHATNRCHEQRTPLHQGGDDPGQSDRSRRMSTRWPAAAASALVIDLIDGRWTLAVLAELLDGGRRYQELDEALGGISHKVLTDTLRRAERDGLVARQLDPGRVDTATLYQLT